MQLDGGQSGAATGLAVQHDIKVAHREFGAAAHLEFQQATRHVHGAWQMACRVFIRLAYVDQHVGVAHGIFSLGDRNFVGLGFSLGDKVVSVFHGVGLYGI